MGACLANLRRLFRPGHGRADGVVSHRLMALLVIVGYAPSALPPTPLPAQRPRIVSVLTRTGGVALLAAVYTCMQVLGQASRALASSEGPRICFRSARSRTSKSTRPCSLSGNAGSK